MDNAKKMMEKWGWNKGQGLGKNKQGMASCLVLRKQDGSATQGRIMMSKPSKDKEDKEKLKTEKPKVGEPVVATELPAQQLSPQQLSPQQQQQQQQQLQQAAQPQTLGERLMQQKQEQMEQLQLQRQQLMQQQVMLQYQQQQEQAGLSGLRAAAGQAGSAIAANLMASMQQGGAALAAASSADAEEAKRRRTSHGWDGGGAGLYDIDPRDAVAAAQAAANADRQAQIVLQQVNFADAGGASPRPTLAQPRQRVRVRQWVVDDWRWSKGTEALRYFEEVTLAPTLLDLAKKIMGPGSRYPARISDDTDCITEVTAWGTLLVRPRGTGANITLAKRMLYEVLHPSGENLREDALITPDEMAEAAVRDQSTISAGANDEEIGRQAKGVKRSFHGDLRRVGLGAEEQVQEDKKEKKAESKTMELSTDEDVKLVHKHLDDLRVASGAICVLSGRTLKMLGKDRVVKKAEYFATTLVATGEWVAFTDSFVISQEGKEKRRENEGPAEQILIKIPEGPITQKIEKNLKAIELAALADTLKLTSKAVGGKRTLMVDGTKAAHERVKLMVKELCEKGESPMLNKMLAAAKKGAEKAASATPRAPGLVIAVKEEESNSVQVAPGVIMAKPVLHAVKEEIKEEDEEEKVAVDGAATAVAPARPKGLGPGPAMRHLPAPKLKLEVVKVEEDAQVVKDEEDAQVVKIEEDSFENLPKPDFPTGGSSGSTAFVVDADAEFPSQSPGPSAFPPLPPGLAEGGLPQPQGDLFAGLPTAAAELWASSAASDPAAAAVMPGAVEMPSVDKAIAEQELQMLAAAQEAGGEAEAMDGITE